MGAFNDYKQPPGGPIELNPDGSPRFPADAVPTGSSTPTPSPTAPVSGATVRAAASGAGQKSFADIMAGLGLPTQDTMKKTAKKATVHKDDLPVLTARGKSYGPVAGRAGGSPGDKTEKQSDAILKIYKDDAFRSKIADQMIAAGLIAPTQSNDLGAIADAWAKVVGQAAQFYQAGNARTPEEVIGMINVQKKAKAAAVPTVQTFDSTEAQTFTDAPTQIRGVLQKMLGRDPSPEEMQSYQAGLTSAAQANPTTSHTVLNTDAQGNQVSNTTKGGGIDPTEVLGQLSQADPEYGAYQASTTYMDALKSAIGAFTGA